jgi:hypothetical protein
LKVLVTIVASGIMHGKGRDVNPPRGKVGYANLPKIKKGFPCVN